MATTTTPDTGELRLALDDILVGDNQLGASRTQPGAACGAAAVVSAALGFVPACEEVVVVHRRHELAPVGERARRRPRACRARSWGSGRGWLVPLAWLIR